MIGGEIYDSNNDGNTAKKQRGKKTDGRKRKKKGGTHKEANDMDGIYSMIFKAHLFFYNALTWG